MEKQEALRKFQEAKKPHDWIKYHKLPEVLTQISVDFKDKHNKLDRIGHFAFNYFA